MLHHTGGFQVAQFSDVPEINPRLNLVAMATKSGEF